MRFTLLLVMLALTVVPVRAGELPTFDDFRRIDRTRRLTGQLQTAELLAGSQIDADLIRRTVQQNTNDAKLVWGAAELVAWPQQRAFFEQALQLSSNSAPVALRFACAAARQGDYDLALQWARFCQQKDSDNTVPWLTELWVLGARKQPQQFAQKPPVWVAGFRDYSVTATEARIRLLEQAGYSAYSARRLGFKPDSDALLMARDLCKPPIEEATRTLLRESSSDLQQRRPFLLSELIGQTIERAVTTPRDDEIEKRRDELKQLVATIERDTVDEATEKQMVQYFDDVLALGEENAMRKLSTAIGRSKSTPAATP